MRLYKKILATGALIASVGLSGCGDTLEGTVKEEFGSAQIIEESSGAMFGNESVKISNQTYGLVLETDKGEYVITVNNHNRKPVMGLAKAIETGDRIRITYGFNTRIGDDRIGKTDSDTIELIERGK
jgi:hypothetical protein